MSIKAQNAAGKHAIATDDALFLRPGIKVKAECGNGAGSGFKANDAIVIKGGVYNIKVEAAGKKAITTDGYADVSGGRITAITTGGVDASDAADPTGCAAIKTDSTLCVTGGEMHLMSTGQGGKGISSDDVIRISGGDIYILTSGNKYGSSNYGGFGRPGGGSSNGNSVSPKGIKGDKDVIIEGGNIFVRTSGSNAEGIESKATLSFTCGNTAVCAYDDGINASKAIKMSGGRLLSISNGQGDGIDSNGSISVTGGTMIGIASTLGSEEGIDLENNTLTMSNATVISLGGGMGSGGGMGVTYSGHYISTTLSGNSGEYVALMKETTPLAVFQLPRNYGSVRLLLSTPTMSSGSYTLHTATTPNGGTSWMNLLEGVISVTGGSANTVTAK